MKKMKSVLSGVIAVVTISSAALPVSAAEETTTVTLNGNQSLVLSAADGKKYYTIDGKNKTEYTTGIRIKTSGANDKGFTVESGSHDIVFEDVKFNDSVVIKKNATANITLEGTNEVTAKKVATKSISLGFLGTINIDYVGKAGINVPEGATLNLSGTGKLTAKGSDDGGSKWGDGGAGIGGNNEENAGNITIECDEKSNIIATGGFNGAGIGGGDNGVVGKFVMESGNVTVNGGGGAAGIGGGRNGAGEKNSDNKGTIEIKGGKVIAKGGKNGAGIGGGYGEGNYGSNGKITISGGIVEATGGEYGAGIGSGDTGDVKENIEITGGKIKATGGKHGAGIGSGCGCGTTDGECGNVIIKDAEIEATAGEEAEPIGGGCDEFGSGKITINGTEVGKEQRKELKNNKTCYIRKNKIIKFKTPFITPNGDEKETEETPTGDEKKTEETPEEKSDTTPVKEKEYAKLNLKNSVLSEDNGLIYSDITKQYLTSTQFIPVKDLKISIGEGYSYKFAEYSGKDKTTYLGSSEWMSGDFSANKLNEDCKYVRIAIKRNDDKQITTKDKTGFTVNGKAFTLNNGAMLSDGLVYSNKVNTSRLSDTQYFETSMISEIEVGNNYQYAIAYYNDGENGKKKFEKLTDWTSEKTTVDTTYRYCRVTVKKADGSALKPTENTGLKVSVYKN